MNIFEQVKQKPNPLCFRQIIFRNCIFASFFFLFLFLIVDALNLTIHFELYTWRSVEWLKWVLFNWSVTGEIFIYIPLDFLLWSWFGDTTTTTTTSPSTIPTTTTTIVLIGVQSIRVQFRNEIALLAGIAPTAWKSQIRLNFTNRCNQTFKTNISLSNKRQ